MARFNSPLNNVSVAAPCSADWDQMVGTDRARFCSQCSLTVYNLSSMGRSEAEHFVSTGEGRICIRYYRRRDGSIITRNCPVGLQMLKRRMSAVARAVSSAVLSFLAGLGVYQVVGSIATGPPSVAGRMVIQGDRVGPRMPPQPPITIPPSNVTTEQPRVFLGKLAPVPRPKKVSKQY